MRFDRYPFSFSLPLPRIVGVLAGIAVLTAIGFLTCGCAPATVPQGEMELAAVDATVAAWEDVVGPVTSAQAEYVRGLEVWEISLEDVQEECGLGHFVLGCVYPEDGYYVRAAGLVRNDRWHVASHEALHVLLWMQAGDSDADHTQADVWSWHTEGTVEALAMSARPWLEDYRGN